MSNMITVEIVRLGQPTEEVSIPVGSSVADALAAADVSANANVKRNGQTLSPSATVQEGDLLIITDKVEGGENILDKLLGTADPISEEIKLFRKYGILNTNGSLTPMGEQAVMEMLFEDKKAEIKAKLEAREAAKEGVRTGAPAAPTTPGA